MFCKRAAGAVFLSLICAACRRGPEHPEAARLAIVRFEDLSGNRSHAWMGRAFSEILTSELTAVRGLTVISSSQMHSLERQTGIRPISAPGISAERSLATLSGATEVGYGDYFASGGKLRVELTLRDAAGLRTLRVLHAEAPDKDVYAAATSLARQIAPDASAFGTKNPAAIEAYATGLEDAAASGEAATRAIAADPNFAPAYRMLAAARMRQQDRDGALAALAEAARRGDAIPPAERARDAVEEATLRNDSAARRRALAEVVKYAPGDQEAWAVLAALSYASRDYPQAITAFQRILEAQPGNAEALNQLAYAYANTGNQQQALAALQRYKALRPDDPNVLDSTGDVYLIGGKTAEAAQLYLETYKKDPHFQGGGDIYKAAMAKLMSGDIAGADAIEKQSDDARAAAHDPALSYRQAQWSWLSGRRKEAYQQMAAFAQESEKGPLREAASAAYSDLAVWSLMLGKRDAAGEMARKALAVAGPKSAAPALLVRFLTQPAANEAEWESRAGQLFRQNGAESVKDLWLAYALLLDKDFTGAGGALARFQASAIGSDESVPVLQAWTLVETGKALEAAPLLRYNPTPLMTGPSLFVTLYFPRLYYLRAVVADKQGKHDEARANYQLFLKLSGDEPLQWGEEQKAQAALK